MALQRRRALLFVLGLSLLAIMMTATRGNLAAGDNPAATENPETSDSKPQKTVIAGFDFANLDRNASACDNFNQFANGGWMANNAIPGAYSVWGRFTQLDEQNTNVLHDILEGLLKKKKLASGNEQKIADFYGSCMDEAKIEGEGAKPLEPEMQRVAQISDVLSLEDEIANLHAHRIPAVFGFECRIAGIA